MDKRLYDVESDISIRLGRRLYDEMVHSDPAPGDVPWEALDRSEQESYINTATTIVEVYLADIGVR